ncbi:proton-conducting transporter transmembrane domain-containing protein [Variovorax sp. PBL-E5]|uniref:proton-conducting transporter transmembrane domain-containing protein n=1 Tax=Variovorax sp. PBL-E5 TaxID=434014 RepID=UPI0013183D50|nr:proton-conducting transporter membrane subunit [Variovorax sp. PBL-E5]VTU46144.1 Hydrogenase-4 component B [Variovorax sp. PBL-E5]
MTALSAAVFVLLVGAAACLLPVRNATHAGIGILSQVVATALVWATVAPILAGGAPVVGQLAWAYPVGTLRVRLDALGAFFLAWSLPMTLLGSIYAVGYLRPHFKSTRHLGVHYALLNLTSLSFVLVYTADHALIFLLGWETAALAAWLLVIWDYTNQKVRFAGFNYLVSTHIGLIFLVAAFMILYTHSGSWDLGSFGRWLRNNAGSERNLVFLLLVTSFGLKSAFFPFHSWLPRAHAAAPAHVSALMSGVIHKAGLYALVRFVFLLGKPDEWMGWFLIGFSCLSAVVGALYTVGQRDLKRLLGYSSTENMGIAGIGFGVGCLGLSWGNASLVAIGFAGGLLHVLNHAFFKCQLFYAAGAVYQATHTVDMERLGGLSRWMPWTSLSFILGGVAIAALPPLNGFTSEFVIYSGLFSDAPIGVWAKVALCVAGALLAFVGAVSALSITRAFGVVFLGVPRDSSVAPPAEVSRWMLVPMGVHAVGVIVLGIIPLLGFKLVQGSTVIALESLSKPLALSALEPIVDTLMWIGAISGGLVLAIELLLWMRSRAASSKLATSHLTWGCGYGAPTPRMQYTGSSFSSDFSHHFRGMMVMLRRHKAPTGYFPTESYLITDCVDAVERRLFSVIGHGDASAGNLSRRLREDDPRVAFAAALIGIVVIAGVLVLTSGPLR